MIPALRSEPYEFEYVTQAVFAHICVSNVSEIEKYGMTALFYGAACSSTRVFQELLDLGAQPHVLDLQGQTCLMMAVELKRIENIKILLDVCHVDPNIQGRDQKLTPLSLSIWNRSLDISEMLLKAGANPNLMDKRGETVLYDAVNSGMGDEIELLMRYGADPRTRREGTMHTVLSAAISQRDLTNTLRFMQFFSISEVLETPCSSQVWGVEEDDREEEDAEIHGFALTEILPRLTLLIISDTKSCRTSWIRLLPVDVLRKLKTMLTN